MENTKKRGVGRPAGTGVFTIRVQVCLSDKETESIEIIQRQYPNFNASDCIRHSLNVTAGALIRASKKATGYE